MKRRCGVRTTPLVEASERGTRKGLEGLGGLRNTEKGHNDEGIVSFLCMEQSTGAIAYPRKARPAASQQELPRAMMLNGWQGMRPKNKQNRYAY